MSANTDSECAEFLDSFVPKMAELEKVAHDAEWELMTHSSPEAERKYADAKANYDLHFNDRETYERAYALYR